MARCGVRISLLLFVCLFISISGKKTSGATRDQSEEIEEKCQMILNRFLANGGLDSILDQYSADLQRKQVQCNPKGFGSRYNLELKTCDNCSDCSESDPCMLECGIPLAISSQQQTIEDVKKELADVRAANKELERKQSAMIGVFGGFSISVAVAILLLIRKVYTLGWDSRDAPESDKLLDSNKPANEPGIVTHPTDV